MFHASHPLIHPDGSVAGIQSIVIIDDDEDMLAYLCSIVNEAGYHALAALSAEQGELLIEKTKVDLIICDIIMPRTDGYTFLERIREKGKLMPFLFLTGKAEKDSLLRAMNLGADGYITKPFDSEELVARVKSMIQNNRIREIAQEHAASERSAIDDNKDEHHTFQHHWLQVLNENILQKINQAEIKIPEIAAKLNVSERTFRNRVKEFTGHAPHEYIMNFRLEIAKKYIREGRFLTVSEVAFAVGINSSSYFTILFKSKYGVTPSQFQQRPNA